MEDGYYNEPWSCYLCFSRTSFSCKQRITILSYQTSIASNFKGGGGWLHKTILLGVYFRVFGW